MKCAEGWNSIKKLFKHLILILLVCLLISASCIGYYAYNAYLIPRIESDYLTYELFSGKLFDIDPQDVKEVFIRRSEEKYTSLHPREYWMQSYESPEEIVEVVQKINSFRYAFWIPKKFSFWQDFPTPIFRITFKNGDWISVKLRKNRCLVGEFGEGDEWSQGAWYYCSGDLYDALMAL